MEQLYRDNFYPNEKRFYEILKSNNITKTHKEVKEFIQKQAVFQIHKPIQNIKSQEKSIVAITENEQMQLDLLDYSKYKTKNKNYAWILIGIDIFTRKGYATYIKTKTPSNVLDGFKLFKVKPLLIIHDDGNEFKGGFLSYLKDNNIGNVVVKSKYHHTLGVVDRFSRTIKDKIEKIFTDKNSVNWIPYLDKIIDNYNNTEHSGILNIKPKDAGNNKDISNLNFWKSVKNNSIVNKEEGLKIGDLVRIQSSKNTLSKGYSNTFSKKVYSIVEIKKDGNIKLDDGIIVNKKDVLKVPAGSVSIQGDKQKKANEAKKIKQATAFAGWY